MAVDDTTLAFLQTLNETPPVEGDWKDFRIQTNGIQTCLKAISSYEAALRTAFILNEYKIKCSCVVVESLDSTRTTFEYEIKHSYYRGCLLPRVILIRKCVCGDVQESAVESTTTDSLSLGRSPAIESHANFEIDSILNHVFGHESFKPLQRETIVKTVSVKTVLAIMGTGGGKSLTFMLPAAVSSKPTVVVSPIRSLIEDLLDRSLQVGIPSCMFIGGMPEETEKQQLRDLKSYKLVYVTPEMLYGSQLMETVSTLDNEGQLERIVFDEAHTISTWGSTFRPVYKDVAERLASLDAPKLLLSATLPVRIQDELRNIFGKHCWEVISHTVYRDNLVLNVMDRGNHFYDDLGKFALEHKEDCGIIYCVMPKDVSKTQGELRKRNVDSVIYHGQLSEECKKNSFEKWMSGEVKLMIANASFGMGIDKPDVRYVVHAKMPTSLEEYFQQCGRAGRDGNLATCRLYYSYADKSLLYKLFKGQGNFNQQCNVLNELIVFLEDPVQCRHKLIMNYFGEQREEFNCLTSCCNCVLQGSHYTSDGTGDALKVVQTLVELGNSKVTCNTLKLILLGSHQKIIQQNNFEKLSNFSCLSKKFKHPLILDKFLHLLICKDIIGEEVETSRNSFSIKVKLGAKAHDLLALKISCCKFVKS